ncbi:MAG: enoyl-CoA hydratase/isomerase family protein [Hydrogenophaga sp.]|uniref:enoyl-CoA hydratase/isomerase family protein n=1 Tax=Hydrogenophaga sp. TaxID=1904254 RepID=UPI00261D90EB|nr:enoyl-CoA hydratase/isomerase family protein [Hydrogenophaga sp.]MCW5668551.1 enoyl-CoA hydratase/isomerase family protein [Hydrogenophaga sp.]
MGIAYDTIDATAVIRFDRPAKLNALTLAMYDDLGRAFAQAGQDDAVRVIVLTGAGERAFCVGADLTESIPALARNEIDISAWDAAHLKHVHIDKPIIGAINGLCMGGGFEIMLATDIRIAAHTAQFSLPEVSLGIVPAGGTLARLTRQVGHAHAMELLLTAGRFSAADLLRMGVLNQVVAPGELMPTTLGLAERISRLSASALAVTKQAVRELADLPLDSAFRREAVLGQAAFTSSDARRGLAAFARGERVDYRTPPP